MKTQTIVAAIVCAFWCSNQLQAQQLPARPKKEQAAASAQGFNVVLVLADLEAGPATPDNVPVAARKALADMKDFLPYKSYKLLDTAWILSASESTNATSRLRGLDERTYELTLAATAESAPVSNRTLRVSFQLRDSAIGEAVHETSQTPSLDYMKAQMALDARRRVAEAEMAARREKEKVEGGQAAPSDRFADVRREAEMRQELEKRLLELRALDSRTGNEIRTRIRLPQNIIDTGFTMDIGETVVVGTSRVKGDKAIIALLTAVPRSGRK